MVTSDMIGKKISTARKLRGLSQTQLAEQLFISSQAVGKLERGESMPDILTFNKLAKLLDVDLNYFSDDFSSLPAENQPNPKDELSSRESSRADRNMSRGNWTDSDFSGLKNLHEKFDASNMKRCEFVGSDLSGLQLRANTIDQCDFSNSNLSNCRISTTEIKNSKLVSATLSNSKFKACNLKENDFSNVDLSGAEIKASTVQNNNFTEVRWTQIRFDMSCFIKTNIQGILDDCSFLNCDFKSLTFENVEFKDCFFKSKGIKKIKFINCTADNISYAFLKNGKADLSGISLLEASES